MSKEQTLEHAVRWVVGERLGGMMQIYSRWHWALNESWTACGRPIAMGTKLSFLPETNDKIEKVECKQCRSKLDV